MLLKDFRTSWRTRRPQISRWIFEFVVSSSTIIHVETVLCALQMIESFYKTILDKEENIPESYDRLVGWVCLHVSFKLIQGHDDHDRRLKIRQFQYYKKNQMFSKNDFVDMERKVLQTLNYQLFPYTQNLIPEDRLIQEITEMDVRVYLVQLMFHKIHLPRGGYDACDELTKQYFIQESKRLIRFRREVDRSRNLPQ